METVTCAGCGSDRSQPVLRQRDLLFGDSTGLEEFTIVRCEGCNLLYLNPRPSSVDIGRYYPTAYFPSVSRRQKSRLEQFLKRFSRQVKQRIMEDFYGYPASSAAGSWRRLRKVVLWPEKTRRLFRGRDTLPWVGRGRLLDLGCSAGGNLAKFQDHGWDVYGIEFSEVAVAQARERFGDRIHHGTLETAPFKDGFFDVVYLSHTLEHLFNPVATLVRLRQLLQPEGMVVITVPNADSLEARLFGRWWVPWDPPRHLYHFGKETLTKVLEQAGLHVVRMRTGVGSLYFITSLERAWTQRFKRRLPARWLIERVVARPFCLLAGHLGQGTEITVYAVKDGVRG